MDIRILDKAPTFATIKPAECFFHDGDTFMRLAEDEQIPGGAVNLKTGEVVRFVATFKVTPVLAVVNITTRL